PHNKPYNSLSIVASLPMPILEVGQMTIGKDVQKGELPLRHGIGTLTYRAAKVLGDAPQDFSGFRAGEGSRSAGEILTHMGDLFDWALSQACGKERWQPAKPRTWSEDTERFFAAVTALDQYLGSGDELHVPPEKLFQGAVADALTHVGQIAML